MFSKIDNEYDLVIGICNGGKFVLDHYVSQHKNVNCTTVTLQRQSTKGVKQKKVVSSILKFLPYSITDKMRIYENQRLQKQSSKSNPKLHSEIEIDKLHSSLESVLILDDAIDSGHTMQTVLSQISKKAPNAQIDTAVLAWTNTNSIVAPTYYMYKSVLVRFPWSIDFKSSSDA